MSFAQLLLSLRMMTDFIGSSSRKSINNIAFEFAFAIEIATGRTKWILAEGSREVVS